MPIPLLVAAAAVPALYKGIKGIAQGIEADRLTLRDTTPQAFRESLGLQRQAAAAALPGMGQAIDRLDAGANNVLAAGARAGTSASSILGLLSNTDEVRRKGLADLGMRGDAYRQQQQRGLQGMLQQQAQYQTNDRLELDRNRAALKEASERNIYGALDAGSQVATYGLQGGGAGALPTLPGLPGAAPTAPPPVSADLPGYDQLNYLPTRRRYGIAGYDGIN